MKRTTQSSLLELARGYAPQFDDSNSNNRQRSFLTEVDKPTQTLLTTPLTPSLPSKPTILVLGATGRIGRLIISTLMESNVDCVVMAHVRDYDKALEVLYDYHDDDDNDDLEITNTAQYLKRKNYALVTNTKKKGGPELKIVVGDLVSNQDVGYALQQRRKRRRRREKILSKVLFFSRDYQRGLFNGTNYLKEEEEEDDLIEIEYPKAFSSSSPTTSNTTTTTTKETITHSEEILHDAITQSTIIISAVSTLRYSNFLTDFFSIFKPWRIFQKDVSSWCVDKDHPYYVCYKSTVKILKMAEREELRREEVRGALKKQQQQEEEGNNNNPSKDDVFIPARPTSSANNNNPDPTSSSKTVTTTPNDKIKIIRITDLALTNKPYGFETIVTNLFCSLIYRYQQMSENILRGSGIVDTVVLRPGDLTDEERNATTTSLQVSSTGTVPQPSKVSRTDVAELAVAAALSNMDVTYDDKKKQKKKKNNANTNSIPNDNIPKSNGVAKKQNDDRTTQNKLPRQEETREARHLTLGVRWTSETLQPEPQGYKKDGYLNAQACMNKVLIDDNKRIKRSKRLEWKRRRKYLRDAEQQYESTIASLLSNVVTQTKTSSSLLQQKRASWLKRREVRKLKPYGLFVALPVYTVMIWMFTSLFGRYIVLPKNRSVWTFLVKRLSVMSLFVKKGLVGSGASTGSNYVGI